MTQFICFVDAGFLKGQGAKRLGIKIRDLRVLPDGCVAWARQVAQDRGGSLLRVYWYDGEFDPHDPCHAAQRTFFDSIRMCPGIQMRLGHLRELTPGWQHQVREAIKACGWDPAEFERHFTFQPKLEQKGVDTLIALDALRLAQRHAYDAAILLSGDRDLAEAVWAVQDEGRQVIVAHPLGGGVATELRHLADEVLAIDHTELASMLQAKQQTGVRELAETYTVE